MKAKGTPAGFLHGKKLSATETTMPWLLWSHGGKMVDEGGRGDDQQPGNAGFDQLTMELLSDLHSGHKKAGRTSTTTAPSSPARISLIANGVSVCCAAKGDPKLLEITKDIRMTNFPIGPVG